jgi:hypothetical protein
VTDWLERVRAAREVGDPGALIERIPYARMLGLSIEREGDGLVARVLGRTPRSSRAAAIFDSPGSIFFFIVCSCG